MLIPLTRHTGVDVPFDRREDTVPRQVRSVNALQRAVGAAMPSHVVVVRELKSALAEGVAVCSRGNDERPVVTPQIPRDEGVAAR
jgi:hypothetical protein